MNVRHDGLSGTAADLAQLPFNRQPFHHYGQAMMNPTEYLLDATHLVMHVTWPCTTIGRTRP